MRTLTKLPTGRTVNDCSRARLTATSSSDAALGAASSFFNAGTIRPADLSAGWLAPLGASQGALRAAASAAALALFMAAGAQDAQAQFICQQYGGSFGGAIAGSQAVACGTSADASGTGALAIGTQAQASAPYASALGFLA